ncbi:hypothetical protein D9M72_185920 [compost metagenome]
MQANDRLRARGRGRDHVHVQRRGIGGKDGARFGDPVQLAEQLLLDLHVLEHRFDDQVGIGQLLQVQRGREQRHAGLDIGRAQAPLARGIFVVAPDRLQAAVQRLLRGLDDGHGVAGVEEVHGDAAAHGAGADDADAPDRKRGRVGAHIGHVPYLARGKEVVALRRRLRAVEQFCEQFALALQAGFERLLHRRLDAADIEFGRIEAAKAARVGLAEGSEQFRLAARGRHLVIGFAHLAQGPLLGHHLARERHRIGTQRGVVGQQVDQAHLRRSAGRHVRARGDHLQRLFRAHDTRQPLGAARPGQQAEIDFRQPALCRARGDAVMAHQRQLQPAAERGAVDSGHHRLGRVLDHGLHLCQRRARRRLAKLGDVRARDKGLAGADQHHGLDRIVGKCARHAVADAAAHGGGQCIDGGRVEGQDGDVGVHREVGHGVDGGHGSVLLD